MMANEKANVTAKTMANTKEELKSSENQLQLPGPSEEMVQGGGDDSFTCHYPPLSLGAMIL